MVAVVEQGDVPAGTEGHEEFQQSARAFGEFELVDHFVADRRGVAADHVADVLLGQVAVGEVDDGVAGFAQFLDQFFAAQAAGLDLDADEDDGFAGIGVAVVEFSDAAFVQGVDEGFERARFFRDGDGQDGFAFFADFGAFGDVAQAVKVHVGAAEHASQVFAFKLLPLDVFFHSGHRQCPCRFCDGAGVFEYVFDGGADFVCRNRDDFIDGVFTDIPGFFPDLFNRHTVCKDTYFVQDHPLTGRHGGLQAVGVFRFHADHFDVRAQVFDVRRHAGDQAAAAHGDEYRVHGLGKLPHHFHGYGALPGNNVRVVVGRDVGVAVFFDQLLGMGGSFVEGVAFEYYPGAPVPH